MTSGFQNERSLNSSHYHNQASATAYNAPLLQTNHLPADFFLSSGYASYGDFYKNMTKFFNLDNPAPFVSAKSWVMTNLNTGELMYAKREKEVR